MGWDFVAHETMKPLELIKTDMPTVTWICTDGKARYKERETAWFGFATGKDGKTFWVVALCQVRRDPKKEGGRRWVGYKVMDESVGPFRKPPENFWKEPRVSAAFSGQRSLFG